MDAELVTLSGDIGRELERLGERLTTAESCTGGWIAQVVTHTAGSSQWFDRGFICYSNVSKHEMLGVSLQVIREHGAVSERVAQAMVRGAVRSAGATVGIAVTGIAGPGGGAPGKPVGTVCFGWYMTVPENAPQVATDTRQFSGGRDTVRRAATRYALARCLGMLKTKE